MEQIKICEIIFLTLGDTDVGVHMKIISATSSAGEENPKSFGNFYLGSFFLVGSDGVD